MTAQAICSVCSGTKRVPYTGEYAYIIAGYDPATKTIPCGNCGGQYMSMKATGMVPLNRQGFPCTHSYVETGPEAKRMYGQHWYTCRHCGDQHYIDSGD